MARRIALDLAAEDLHAALAAGAVAGAGRVDGDVRAPRGLEQRHIRRRREDNRLVAVFKLEGNLIHRMGAPFGVSSYSKSLRLRAASARTRRDFCGRFCIFVRGGRTDT